MGNLLYKLMGSFTCCIWIWCCCNWCCKAAGCWLSICWMSCSCCCPGDIIWAQDRGRSCCCWGWMAKTRLRQKSISSSEYVPLFKLLLDAVPTCHGIFRIKVIIYYLLPVEKAEADLRNLIVFGIFKYCMSMYIYIFSLQICR